MLQSLLTKWGYEVIAAEDGEQAWQVLQSDKGPSLAVLDWLMPGLDGLEVSRRVRSSDRESYVYILLLTAKAGKENLIEGMEAGADDYIVKPFNPHELKVRLRAGRRILELHAALLAAREQLREQATRDALTGLWNRAAVLEALRRELVRSQREHVPMCVVMADLDHFKQINDTRGHLAGDAVLREVGRRMQHAIRSYDSVARYGGEEFLCVVPRCDLRQGVQIAERIRAAVAEQPFDTGCGSAALTMSLGVAEALNMGEIDEQAIVRAADEALYRAKQSGRNRVEAASTCEAVA